MGTSSEVNGNGAATAGKDLKLEALRQLMREADGGRGVDAYIVPTEDPHMVCLSLCLSPLLVQSSLRSPSFVVLQSLQPQWNVWCVHTRPSVHRVFLLVI